MPTGYTAKLHDGEEQTVSEFIVACAHAFGALILLRDEGMDAPIPEFAPHTTYDDERIVKGLARINEVSAWSTEEADKQAAADYQERLASWREWEASKEAIRGRYEAMRRQVEAWTPPTQEHEGLKKFMLDQLDESTRFDAKPCAFSESLGGSDRRTGEEHQARIIRMEEESVARARKSRDEEIERTAGRNAWVRALLDSLPQSVRSSSGE